MKKIYVFLIAIFLIGSVSAGILSSNYFDDKDAKLPSDPKGNPTAQATITKFYCDINNCYAKIILNESNPDEYLPLVISNKEYTEEGFYLVRDKEIKFRTENYQRYKEETESSKAITEVGGGGKVTVK